MPAFVGVLCVVCVRVAYWYIGQKTRTNAIFLQSTLYKIHKKITFLGQTTLFFAFFFVLSQKSPSFVVQTRSTGTPLAINKLPKFKPIILCHTF